MRGSPAGWSWITLPRTRGFSGEGRVTKTVKRRRRWPLVIAAIVLILVAAPLAWQLRPLTADERALVGHWRSVTPSNADYFLSADRRFRITFDAAIAPDRQFVRGTWTAYDSSFHVRARPSGSPWRNPLRRCYAWITAPTESAKIRFDGPDRFWMEKVEFVRVPDEASVR